MCYLNQVMYCKICAMLYLNYVKINTNSTLCFNNTECLSNYVTQKKRNVFCVIQSKHSSLSAMCNLNQVKQYKTITMLFLNYVKHKQTKHY